MQRSHTITPQAFAERARPATLADCVAGLACEMQFDGVWHGGARCSGHGRDTAHC